MVKIQRTCCKMSQRSFDKKNPKSNLKKKEKSTKKSDETTKNEKAKTKKVYTHFSDDEEPKNESEELR